MINGWRISHTGAGLQSKPAALAYWWMQLKLMLITGSPLEDQGFCFELYHGTQTKDLCRWYFIFQGFFSMRKINHARSCLISMGSRSVTSDLDTDTGDEDEGSLWGAG